MSTILLLRITNKVIQDAVNKPISALWPMTIIIAMLTPWLN